jgi:hypothetical protein
MTIQKKWFLTNLVFFLIAITALFVQVKAGNNSDLFFATSLERMVCADCGEEVWVWSFKSSILRVVFGVEAERSSLGESEGCKHDNLKPPPPPKPIPVKPGERERRAVKETLWWITYVYPFTDSNWWTGALLLFALAVATLNLYVKFSTSHETGTHADMKKTVRLQRLFRHGYYASAVLCVLLLMMGTVESRIFTAMAEHPSLDGVSASYLEAQIDRIRSHLAAVSQVVLSLAFIVFGARMFALSRAKGAADPGMQTQSNSIPG